MTPLEAKDVQCFCNHVMSFFSADKKITLDSAGPHGSVLLHQPAVHCRGSSSRPDQWQVVRQSSCGLDTGGWGGAWLGYDLQV